MIWRVQVDEETRDVIEIGVRRYTTVIVLDQLSGLQQVPTDQLSDAVAQTIDEIDLNVRVWTAEDGTTREVVAVARGEDDSLMVVELQELLPAVRRLPLDEVNSGDRRNR